MFFKKKEKEGVDEELIKKVQTNFQNLPDKEVNKIKADVEKVKAFIETQKEMGKVRDERLSRLNEQIGELRSQIVEKDKQIKDLETKALKAADMVEMVQPDKLMVEVKKSDMKSEVLKTKLDSYSELLGRIKDELKEIRQKVEVFRGVDGVIELSKEVREDINTVRKIQAGVKNHADKVESLYIKSEVGFDEFNKFKKIADDLNSEFNLLLRKAEKKDVRFPNLAEKSDVRHVKKEVLNELKEQVKRIDSELKKLHETDNYLKKRHKVMGDRIKQWINYFLKNKNP
jgi:chromosome segregation ATPase